jgi:hypothetical protein
MSRGIAYIIRPGDETPDPVSLIQPPSINWMRRTLEGDYEQLPHFTVYLKRRCKAYINRDAKLPPPQPFNRLATRLWHISTTEPILSMADYVAGPLVILCGDLDFMQDVIERLRKHSENGNWDAGKAADELERLRKVLAWIDNFDPETIAAAEAKFGKLL